MLLWGVWDKALRCKGQVHVNGPRSPPGPRESSPRARDFDASLEEKLKLRKIEGTSQVASWEFWGSGDLNHLGLQSPCSVTTLPFWETGGAAMSTPSPCIPWEPASIPPSLGSPGDNPTPTQPARSESMPGQCGRVCRQTPQGHSPCPVQTHVRMHISDASWGWLSGKGHLLDGDSGAWDPAPGGTLLTQSLPLLPAACLASLCMTAAHTPSQP